MHIIVYTSETTVANTAIESALSDIYESSLRHNKANDITGILIYENRRFFQAIEGEELLVHSTYGRIEEDPRHKNLVIHDDSPIEARSFPSWLMDTFVVRAPELVDAEAINFLHNIYDRKFKLDRKDLIVFHQKMIEEGETCNVDRFNGQ